MGSWQGAHLNHVIAQWGYPHQEQSIAGRKLYRWSTTRTITMPSATTGTVTIVGDRALINATTIGGEMLTGGCIRTIEVNEQNVVVRWEWSGNNCPFADIAGEYATWQRR